MSVTSSAMVVIVALVAGSPSYGESPSAARVTPSPGPVSTVTTTAWSPTTVVDGRGRVTVAWATDPRQGLVLAATRPAGGHWSAPATIGRGSDPVAVVDRAGVVTVVFETNRPGRTTGLAAVRRPPHGAWGHPVRLTRDRRAEHYSGYEGVFGAHRLDVAADPAGDVVVTWQWGSYDRNRPFRIEVVVKRPGRAWSRLRALTPRDWSRDPRVAVDDRGRVTLVYDRQGFLVVRRLEPGQGWSSPRKLVSDAAVLDFDLTVTPVGRALILVSDYRHHQARAMLLSRVPAGRWTRPRRLSPAGVSCSWTGMAVAGPDSVAVAWERRTGRVELIRSQGRRWSPVFGVAPDISSFPPQLVADRSGSAVLAWETGHRTIRARVRTQGGTWTRAFTLWPRPLAGYYETVQTTLMPTGDILSTVWRGRAVRVRRVHIH